MQNDNTAASVPGQACWSLSGLALLAAGLGLFTCGMLVRAGVQGLGAGALAAIVTGWFVLGLLGALVLGLCAQNRLRPDLSLAVAAGIVVGSIVLLVLCELLPLSAAQAFVVLGGTVICVVVLRRGWFSLALSRSSVAEILGVLCSAALVGAWCWVSLGSVGRMPQTGTLSLWTDSVIHASTIQDYGGFRRFYQGSFEFIDSVRPLYHFGSYLLPAAALPLADISGLQAAAALHLPIGLLAMFASAFALAREIAGSKAGWLAAFLAVFLLCLLPDPSTYWLANGWFSGRWMLLASPGSGYAIAGVLISLVLAKVWLDTRAPSALIAAFVFALLVFQLRVHMLVWYGPALVLLLFAGEPRLRKLVPYALLAGVLGVLALLPLANILPYLTYVHSGMMEPTGYTGLYVRMVAAWGEAWSAPLGLLLLLIGMLGGLLLLYPLAAFACRRLAPLGAFDLFPVFLGASAMVVILFAPPFRFDPFELKHRAFVLLYVVALVWTVGLGTRFAIQAFGYRATMVCAGTLAAALLLLAAWHPPAFLDADRPKFAWGRQYVDRHVPQDLTAAADFVRRQTSGAEVAIILPVDDQAGAADNATFFSAIANTPLYLSRYALRPADIARSRLEVIEGLRDSPDFSGVQKQMASRGFHWFVLNSTTPPAFDPDFSRPAFRRGSWAVYDFR